MNGAAMNGAAMNGAAMNWAAMNGAAMNGAATNRPRIAYVLTQNRGGPVDVCVQLAARLRAQEIDVRVFGPRPARGAEQLSGAWEELESPSKLDARSGRRMRAAIAAWRPDVVHAQDRRAGLVVAPMRGVVRLQTYHGVPEDVAQSWFDERRYAPAPSRYTRVTLAADAVVARVLDRTVVPSPSMAAFLRSRLRVPSERLVHIDNGISQAPPPAAMSGPVRNLLFVGLLLQRKGLTDLLDALALPGVFPADARLTIAGDGPERATVERAAAAGPLAGRIRFLGFRSDVGALMAEADAVVVPSRMEQQPIVVIEAMVAGRPVLATDTGDVARMLDASDAHRYLAPPGDVGALAARLRELFADPDPARTGRALVERAATLFDVTVSADAHLALYGELVGVGGQRVLR